MQIGGTGMNIGFCWCPGTNLGTVPGHRHLSEQVFAKYDFTNLAVADRGGGSHLN